MQKIGEAMQKNASQGEAKQEGEAGASGTDEPIRDAEVDNSEEKKDN